MTTHSQSTIISDDMCVHLLSIKTLSRVSSPLDRLLRRSTEPSNLSSVDSQLGFSGRSS
ncbi:hypothetical protein Scep_014176 [Stephania cephalantha]|uniref:Uncharacterized protein n=1 Tax=Stephania cephalantha TaxID=152367 RepID=A0AAP0J1I5_9MAGN